MFVIFDCTDDDLGKHAYSQMKEFGVDSRIEEEKFLEVPGKIARSDSSDFLVIASMDERFAEQVVARILELENENRIEKIFLEKHKESREVFNRRAQRKVREKAEKIAGGQL